MIFNSGHCGRWRQPSILQDVAVCACPILLKEGHVSVWVSFAIGLGLWLGRQRHMHWAQYRDRSVICIHASHMYFSRVARGGSPESQEANH